MSYVKTNWVNGVTPVNASNMNKIENGIENALAKPDVAPVELGLVGIDTDNSQARISFGDGFRVTGDTSPYQIDVSGIVESRDDAVMSIWVGTQAQYDAVTTKSSTTIYFIVG